MKKRALISVSDKTGVVEFAKNLEGLGYEIISTGGTLATLKADGVKAVSISDITGFPECLDGRVKTLHPKVHAGLLARRDNPSHMQSLKDLDVETIDLVAVNLYPFKQTVSKPDVTREEAIENIDIGGPTMLRSAAKNYRDVIVVCEPSDYADVISTIESGGADEEYKLRLAYKVFRHTAAYDSLISQYMQNQLGIDFPMHITFAYDKVMDLRYGENPHQGAAFYREPITPSGSLADAEQLNGKELSYNNINDANGAIELVREFSAPTIVASKHTNPCGVATADNILSAYKRAYECDPVSIFGGVVASNRIIDEATAEEMSKIFLEIVIAPDFTDGALNVLRKKKNLRLLKLADLDKPMPEQTYDFKRVHGGLLVQYKDASLYTDAQVKVVTKRAPTQAERAQLEFAYKVVKHTKSNAIVVGNDNRAVGVGPGQTNRIWACEQALERAGEFAKGGVLASDAFFPFDDCVKAAAKAGITAIIQPGGSVRDEDSIKACDEAGIAMIFVGERHFKH